MRIEIKITNAKPLEIQTICEDIKDAVKRNEKYDEYKLCSSVTMPDGMILEVRTG